MTKEVEIALSQKYVVHSVVFDRVKLREPSFNDLLELGEPYEMQMVRGGLPVVIENTATVAQYVRRAIVDPDQVCLTELTFDDSRKVRDAVLGFFRRGEEPDASPSKA